MKLVNRLVAVTLCVIGAMLVATAQEAVPQPPPTPASLRAAAAAAARKAAAVAAAEGDADEGVRTITPRGRVLRPSETAGAADAVAGDDADVPALKFDQSPVDLVLAAYAEVTGRTLLIAPDIPKPLITLRSNPQTDMTREMYLEAIERILNMNGIVLIPIGEPFLRVESSKTVMKRGFETAFEGAPEAGHVPKGQFVSQMIHLKNLPVDEARKAIEGFKRDDGQIQIFERTNSILILDSAENLNRMLEIINFIDVKLPIREQVFYRKINFAKAADIKRRLDEIVAESKKEIQGKESVETKTTGSPGIEIRRPTGLLPPGVRRASAVVPEAPTPNEVIETLVSDAERGMIRGRVNIVADERSNQLIIITSEDNMKFFDDLIVILDIKTAPNFIVEVMRLEHADAEEVAKMINDLIGNVAKKDDAPQTPGAGPAGAEPRTQTLAEAVASRLNRASAPAGGEPAASKVGELNKDNIKVLPDKRINGIIIMASQGDLDVIKGLINSMDVMLSQVLIETVVLEVGLGDGIEAGIDWVKKVNQGPGWAIGGAGKVAAGITVENLIANTVSNAVSLAQNGIAYYTKIDSLNLALVIKAAASDSRSKVLASPVIQTMDNKEATIKATDLIYLFNGKKAVAINNTYTYEDDYVQKEIGITVTVTPRINAKGNVVMTVKQVFQDKGTPQKVNDSLYETTTTREINADVIVNSGQTIILGGLVKKSQSSSKSGIPFLSTIPYLGWIFGYTANKETRSELLVFLTPYVFANQDEASAEAHRRREALGRSADGLWTQGWSKSPMAEPEPVEDVVRRERSRIAREQEERKATDALQKLRKHEADRKARDAARNPASSDDRDLDAPTGEWDTAPATADATPVITPAATPVASDAFEPLPAPTAADATPVTTDAFPVEPLLAPIK